MKWQNLTPRILRAFISVNLIFGLFPQHSYGQPKSPANPVLQKCWAASYPGIITRLNASDNAKAVIFTEEVGKVGALDPLDGKQIWLTDFGGKIASNIAIDQTVVLFASISESISPDRSGVAALRAISVETGVTIWTASLPLSDRYYLDVGEKFVYTITELGRVAAYNRIDGSTAWQTDLAARVTSVPAFSNESIAVAVESGDVVIISNGTGERLQTVKLQNPAVSLAIGGGSVISGDQKGNLVLNDTFKTGPAWKFKSGGQISSISVTKEGLLVSSYDNFLYLIGSNNGNILWKRRLSGRLLKRPEISESTAVITVLGESGASIIDLKSGKITGKITGGNDDGPIELTLLGNTVILTDGNGITAYSATGCGTK